MKHRITLKKPDYFHNFDIQNGSATQPFTWWEFRLDWNTLKLLGALTHDDISGQLKLDEMLRIVGSHATLWIGNWKGVIAPMDVQPQGWTYPSGRLLEDQWWWQWHPDSYSEESAVATLNANPLDAWDSQTPLKSGVPFQMQRSMGEVSAIDAIPIQKLPHLVRKDALWVFEFDS